MSEDKTLAETPTTRLVCDGKEHRGVDKRTGASYRLRACDCKKETK